MFLFKSDAAVATNLNDLLKTEIPAVKGKGVILNKLAHWSGLSRKQVEQALTFGNDPRVKVTQLTMHPILSTSKKHQNKQVILGNTPNNATRHVEIEVQLIRMLEAPLPPKHTPTPRPPVKDAVAGLRKFIRNVLLHELVHLGNNISGTVWQNSAGAEIEAGFAFEKDAQIDKDPVPSFYRTPQAIEDTPLYWAVPNTPPLTRRVAGGP